MNLIKLREKGKRGIIRKKKLKRKKTKKLKGSDESIAFGLNDSIKDIFKILFLSHKYFVIDLSEDRIMAFILGYSMHSEVKDKGRY